MQNSLSSYLKNKGLFLGKVNKEPFYDSPLESQSNKGLIKTCHMLTQNFKLLLAPPTDLKASLM